MSRKLRKREVERRDQHTRAAFADDRAVRVHIERRQAFTDRPLLGWRCARRSSASSFGRVINAPGAEGIEQPPLRTRAGIGGGPQRELRPLIAGIVEHQLRRDLGERDRARSARTDCIQRCLRNAHVATRCPSASRAAPDSSSDLLTAYARREHRRDQSPDRARATSSPDASRTCRAACRCRRVIVAGAAPFMDGIEARERGRGGDAEIVRIRQQLRQRDGQRGEARRRRCR